MNAKVKLEIKRPKPYHFMAKGWQETAVTQCLPFYRSTQGKYIHRVRYGKNYLRDGKVHHIALTMWCGQGGFLGDKKANSGSELFELPPEKAICCATCEGRAIGSGMYVPPFIDGRPVCFSPRQLK
jgi:hypothetical protein